MCSYANISKPDIIRKHYYFTSHQFHMNLYDLIHINLLFKKTQSKPNHK